MHTNDRIITLALPSPNYCVEAAAGLSYIESSHSTLYNWKNEKRPETLTKQTKKYKFTHVKKTYTIVMIGCGVIGISISGFRLRDLHLFGGNYFHLIPAVVFHELRIFSYIRGHYFRF